MVSIILLLQANKEGHGARRYPISTKVSLMLLPWKVSVKSFLGKLTLS